MLRVLTKKDGYIIPNSIGTDRNKWFGAIPSFISKPADYLTVGCVTNHENLQRIADLSVEKELRVVIDIFFSFEETPTALNRMASRRAAGQVIHHQGGATGSRRGASGGDPVAFISAMRRTWVYYVM
jgi:3-keto-L-gulonate-6-phosphate decarboxylase